MTQREVIHQLREALEDIAGYGRNWPSPGDVLERVRVKATQALTIPMPAAPVTRRVDLSLCTSRYFAGVIIPSPSSVLWSNRVGGRSSIQLAMEGIFLPITLPHVLLDPLMGLVEIEYDPKLVRPLLEQAGLTSLLAPVERSARPLSEAWVAVTVRDTAKDDCILGSFVGAEGILTYSNSG